MTAKVNKKKLAIIFAAVVVVIAALVLLITGGNDATPTASTNVSNNDARVAFLKGFGWKSPLRPSKAARSGSRKRATMSSPVITSCRKAKATT
jgi:hypothetical protein